MKSLLPSALALALMGVSAAAGAAPSAADTNAIGGRKAAALDMLEACNTRAEMAVYFEKVAESTANDARQQYSQLSDEQWGQFTAAFRANLQGYLDRYIEFAATVDATHLTVADMKVLADFCRSPEGKRIAAIRIEVERDTFSMRETFLRKAIADAGAEAMRSIVPETPGGGL